jgi:phosphoglycolate phosphatase-like HAD superfamily hydrolase
MSRKKLLFLDFDGVICDSAKETARTAWLAGSAIWENLRNMDIPAQYVKKFRKLRPVINKGFESIALIKLIDENYSENFIKKEFYFLSEQIFTSVSMEKKKLTQLFGKVRDDWSAINPAAWIGCHRIYNCSKSILEAGENFYKNVFIVSTKQKRFIEKIFSLFGIAFDSDKIYGLEAGEKKEDVILSILDDKKCRADSAVIVEDRCDTLKSFAGNREFKKSVLFLASWGYVFPEDLADIKDNFPQIKIISQENAAENLKNFAK